VLLLRVDVFLRLRMRESVKARAAWRLVRVDALEPFFRTARACACVDLPERFAFALNAPGRFIAPLIHFFFATEFHLLLFRALPYAFFNLFVLPDPRSECLPL